MNYSKYQRAIFDFIHDKTENALIEAVAGSGKTTTLVQGSRMLPAKPAPTVDLFDLSAFGTVDDSLFIAFNKHIAEAISKRLPAGCTASTLHSLGYGICRSQLRTKRADPNKVDRIMDRLAIPSPYKAATKELRDEAKARRYSIESALSIIKATLCSPDELAQVCEFYSIYVHDDSIFPTAYRILEIGNAEPETVDFDDMYYLPLINNCNFQPVSCLFVDEEQDMCRAQNEFLARYNSRIIAVGDRRQSIYGFRGADPSAMDWLKKRVEATELSLSICYRCPKAVVELAKTIVPQIEPWDGAADGFVKTIDHNQFYNGVAPDDMILCRYNAPLVEIAFDLIKDGVKATIRGRDIGKNIATFAKRFYQQPRTMETCLALMRQHYMQETSKPCTFEKKRNLMDKISVVEIIASKYTQPDRVPVAIELLFADEHGDVILSSIHKAKGEEADNVFIIETDDVRKGGRQSWEEVQELNCRYVAITRAKRNLYFVKQEEEMSELFFYS